MSLLRPILRCAAVGALRESQTWAEDRVYDSDLTPLAEAVYGKGTAKPYIVIYTDTDDISPVTGISELYSGDNRSLSLVMEIGVASAIRAVPTDPSSNIRIQFAATDSGMEWACDVIGAQALAALSGSPKNPWGDVFKRMVTRIRRVPSRRGGMANSGVRFAARRTTLVIEPIWDFVPGVLPAPQHPVWDFIKLARSDSSVSQVDVATIVESFVLGAPAPEWRIAQSQMGITQAGAEALMAGVPLPYPGVEDPVLEADPNEYVPPFLDVTVTDSDA